MDDLREQVARAICFATCGACEVASECGYYGAYQASGETDAAIAAYEAWNRERIAAAFGLTSASDPRLQAMIERLREAGRG